MRIDEVMEQNKRFLQERQQSVIGHAPRKQLAVVTCMDCRLVQMFESALGIQRGDVVEMRTAGATISVPERAGGANDLIRSIAGSVYLLGVREVMVIGHTECGLAHANPIALTSAMQALGVDPDALIKREGLRDVNGLLAWLGAFHDVHMNVREVVQAIRTSPFLPKLPVHGLVIDIITGKLEIVDRAAA